MKIRKCFDKASFNGLKAVYKQCLFLYIGMNDSKRIIKVPSYVPYIMYLLVMV